VDVYDAIMGRRTVRRFKQDLLPLDVLEKLVECARVAPSAANLQPCEYIIVNDPELVGETFSTLKWAGYIAPRGDPPAGERPVAYIAVIFDTKKHSEHAERDVGAAVENMLLCAWEMGIGTCWLGSIDKKGLAEILSLPSYCKIDSIIALGYKNEEPVLEEAADSIKYWKDEKGVLHVPKRKLNEILHINGYRV
jgi:nitroreductase